MTDSEARWRVYSRAEVRLTIRLRPSTTLFEMIAPRGFGGGESCEAVWGYLLCHATMSDRIIAGAIIVVMARTSAPRQWGGHTRGSSSTTVHHDAITRLMLECTEVDGEQLQPRWVGGFWVDDAWYGGYLEWTLYGWKLAGKSGPIEYGAFELVDRKIVPLVTVETLTSFYRQVDAQKRERNSFGASRYSSSGLSGDQLSRIDKSRKFNERYNEVAARSGGLGCAVWVIVIVALWLLVIVSR